MMPPDTAAPPEDTSTLTPTDAGEQMLDEAEAKGALKPLEAALKAEGADLSARDCIKYAQFDDRTKAKPPEELAAMLAEDTSLIADIAAEKAKQEGGEEEMPSANTMMEERMKSARASEMPTE